MFLKLAVGRRLALVSFAPLRSRLCGRNWSSDVAEYVLGRMRYGDGFGAD